MTTSSGPRDPLWDYRNAERCTWCKKLEKPMLETEMSASLGGFLLGLVVGVPASFFVEGPWFWEGASAVFGMGLVGTLLFWGIASVCIWLRHGRRPRPPRGWCDCGDGGN